MFCYVFIQTIVAPNGTTSYMAYIYATEEGNGSRALEMIEEIAREIEAGKIYKGKVERIMNFGAFVSLGGGKEGLLHISKIAKERVEKVEDYLKVGQEVMVKVLEIDAQDRINLTMRIEEENKSNENSEEGKSQKTDFRPIYVR